MRRRSSAVAMTALLFAFIAPGCAELASGLNEPPGAAAPAAPALDPPPMTDSEPEAPPPVLSESPVESDPAIVRTSAEAVPSASPSSAPSSTGRVIARVGTQAVTLPQLTAAVKARLAKAAST